MLPKHLQQRITQRSLQLARRKLKQDHEDEFFKILHTLQRDKPFQAPGRPYLDIKSIMQQLSCSQIEAERLEGLFNSVYQKSVYTSYESKMLTRAYQALQSIYPQEFKDTREKIRKQLERYYEQKIQREENRTIVASKR